MSSRSRIHVIDSNTRRRAEVSRELFARDVHAEVYEDLAEFSYMMPADGIVLAADDQDSPQASILLDIMRTSGNLLPVAMYADCPSPEQIVRAMLDGALDYLQWPFDDKLLTRAVHRLESDGNELLKKEQGRSEAKAAVASLTNREKDVLTLMVEGLTNKDIGTNLGISSRTVEIHRGNLMRKLNARSVSDAVRIALYAGLDEAIPAPRLLRRA